ncbi:NAD(+) synthase [Candidatus Uhrbacteria bacterium]|nr:NAD(+) synthase [Candidatus Uhrbacteria bacterium]
MRTDYGFARVAAIVPRVHVGDPEQNALEILGFGGMLDHGAIQLAVFPELCLTGYTCGDLFDQDLLQEQVLAALHLLLRGMPHGVAYVVGMPLALHGQRFNVAVVCANGVPLAVIPKVHIPNYKEFYEGRWFRPASELRVAEVDLCGYRVPIGTDILVELVPRNGARPFRVGVEICEDLWMPNPPSSHHALAGATVLVNPSASPVTVGKADYRRQLVGQQSARCVAAYVYAGAGPHESSSDVVFDGHALIAENGSVMEESKRFSFDSQHIIADVDVERLERERRLTGSFSQGIAADMTAYRIVRAEVTGIRAEVHLHRTIDPAPFVPSDPAKRDERCEEVFAVQVAGLRHRLAELEHVIGKREVAIGISGGLDSTLALLVTVRTFDALGWDRAGIHAYTLPGYGTTERTRGNAHTLCEVFGIPLREVSIIAATDALLRAEGHEPCRKCRKCENAQAEVRMAILRRHGFVVGTGDLSESALGWCTYGGDHLPHYGVNVGVPKTLIQYVVAWVAERRTLGDAVSAVLADVVATPISPELLPPDVSGMIAQKTEDLIGPYALHDFFLFHFLRNGFAPRKIAFLAERAFTREFSPEVIRKWLVEFYRRFPSAQFKRNAAPDGPKVGSVALSQRGDWRMPSDIDMAIWRQQALDLLTALAPPPPPIPIP